MGTLDFIPDVVGSKKLCDQVLKGLSGCWVGNGLWRPQRGGCRLKPWRERGVTATWTGWEQESWEKERLGMDSRPPGSGPAAPSAAPHGQQACLPRATERTSEKR